MKESESISHCRAGVTDGFARARAIEWFEAVNLRLSEGGIVKFSPKGFSMWPVIRPDTDTVYISRTAEYSRSDIVLAFCEHPRGVFLHRISQVLPDGVILMGDTNLYQTERCRYADVIGKIVGIERDGYEVSGSVMSRRGGTYATHAGTDETFVCKVFEYVFENRALWQISDRHPCATP